MGNLLRVLLVEDSLDDTTLLLQELKRGGYDLIYQRVDTAIYLRQALTKQEWDIVLSDYRMPHFSGMDALHILKQSHQEIPFIFVSATIGEDTAISAMKAGASDYVMKGQLKRLLPAIERELKEFSLRRDRKRDQEALSQHELLFRQLTENMQDIFWIATKDFSKIRYISPSYENTFGFSIKKIYNNPLHLLNTIHTDDKDLFKNMFNKLIEEKTNINFDCRIVCQDGSIRWTNQRGFQIKYLQDESDCIACVASDITERKQRDVKILNNQLELAHRDRVCLMGEMASTLAHELNQPLTAIATLSQLCVEKIRNKKKITNEIEDLLIKISNYATRSGDIIHQIKNFIWQNGELTYEIIDINKLINETLNFLECFSNDSIKINIKLDIHPLPSIAIGKVHIQQVLLNLIRNSMDAMYAEKTLNPTITIQTQMINVNTIQISVIDNGPGFSRNIKNRLFEPYFTTKPSGTGMGLAICRSLIEAHGGKLIASSKRKKGAQFQFTLPIADYL